MPHLAGQLHRLQLELSAELPSLHRHPPVEKTRYLGVHETGSSSRIKVGALLAVDMNQHANVRTGQ